jgi:hypothetical protein
MVPGNAPGIHVFDTIHAQDFSQAGFAMAGTRAINPAP